MLKDVDVFANKFGQIFHDNGKTKSWDYIKSEYKFESKLKCR